jgi:peptidoglycan DL-endopeptidase CwlO
VARHPRRSRRLVAGLAALAVLTLAGVGPGAASPADAAPADSPAPDLGVLNERYNLARLRLDQATAGLLRTEAELEATRDRAVEVRALVRARAAELYRRSAGGGITGLLGATDVHDLARRSEYVGAAAKPDRALMKELDRALGKLAAQQQSQRDAQSRLRAEADAAAAARRKLLAEAAAARAAAELRQRAEGAGPVGTPRMMQATSASSGSGQPVVQPGTTPPTAKPSTPPPSSPNPSTPPPPASSRAAVAVAYARAQLGKPYAFATSGPNTFDCSGLTMAAWRAAGVSMAHYSGSQAASFPKVGWDQLQPGDIVVFYADLHHVGLYIGAGQMIHAPRTGDVVKISPAWRTEFQFGVRPG